MRSPAQVLVLLLLAAQIALPATAAMADAPPSPVAHQEHLAPAHDPGCAPQHDDLHCLLCRALSLRPLAGSRVAAPLPRVVVGSPLATLDSAPIAAGASSTIQARAPPLSS